MARAGHTPVSWTTTQSDVLHGFEALVVEPASAGCFSYARAVRSARPALPIVCVSIYPPTPDVSALGASSIC
ncbi:MAG TPA: hypothetical protein VES61_02440 [Gaiellaceae bacterium]|nr:hypothetical protein [Gaiellaceae bacterium]